MLHIHVRMSFHKFLCSLYMCDHIHHSTMLHIQNCTLDDKHYYIPSAQILLHEL